MPDAVIPVAPPPVGMPARARIWPVFVALVGSLVLVIVLQFALGILIGIGMAIRNGATGQELNVAEIERFFATPIGFILMGILSQTAFFAATWVALLETRVSRRSQLGLARPRMPWWGYPAIALGSLLVALLGNVAATPVAEHFGSSIDFDALRAQLGWGTGIMFVSFLGIVPGIVEELFFRGYVQRRLLQRWPAWAAILVTSAAFAAMHMDLSWMVFALPIGVWLGVVAWRSGSVWPAVAGHMTINTVVNLQSLAASGSDREPDAWNAASLLLLLAASVFGLIVSIVILVRLRPPPRPVVQLDAVQALSENRVSPEWRAFDPGV